MKEDSNKKMLFEMMNKVGGMPLNENYPLGANEDPDAPWHQDDEEGTNEPDPDEGRDDMSENDSTTAKIINVLVNAQNAIQDIFEQGLPIEISNEEQQHLSDAMKIIRRLEIKYGDENHGITSIMGNK